MQLNGIVTSLHKKMAVASQEQSTMAKPSLNESDFTCNDNPQIANHVISAVGYEEVEYFVDTVK